jgi:hypothetical protein
MKSLPSWLFWVPLSAFIGWGFGFGVAILCDVLIFEHGISDGAYTMASLGSMVLFVALMIRDMRKRKLPKPDPSGRLSPSDPFYQER